MRSQRIAQKNSSRRSRAAWVCFSIAAMVWVGTVAAQDARYLEPIPWEKEHFRQVIGLGYPELGIELDVAHAEMRTIGGTQCAVANFISFDVDDDYAFEIDEPVELTLTYAPEHTDAATFMVVWDQNGGEGHGVIEITPEPGSGFRRTTVNLERARFAGLGAKQTDLAIGARRGRVALCDIAIARSYATRTPATFGQIELTVTEKDTGRPIPARVGIYDVTGRAPMPSDDAIPVNRFTDVVRRHWLNRRTMWPSDNRQAFYMDGQYSARLPVGTYELIVTRGPEYRAYRGEFEINDGKDTAVTVIPVRYANLPDAGWYSGDAHVHLGRSRVDDLDVWGQMAAEDVHVANLLEMGNIAGTYFGQPAWGIEGRFEREGYVLVPGLEDPRTGHRGHTMHWNVGKKEHADADVFYQYDRVFQRTRAQGAITGYAHLGSLFNGERGLALDVPFGLIDFIEVLQGGRLTTDIWYGFLNLGYRVLPAAGADYPYFGPTLPGVERTYVRIDGEFSASAWFESYQRGRTYVTNGPFLELSVNDRGMGEELRVARGDALTIRAEARLNPDIEALTRLEIVVLGDVVTQQPASDSDYIELTHRLNADHSMWIAARAYGVHDERWYTTVAHSAPVYVVVEGEPTWKKEAVSTLVQEQMAHLDDLLSAPVNPIEDLESFETGDALIDQWTAQRQLTEQRVEKARAKYRQLLDLASEYAARTHK